LFRLMGLGQIASALFVFNVKSLEFGLTYVSGW
jgi:hypothetical protein